jgi:hypothetical protein
MHRRLLVVAACGALWAGAARAQPAQLKSQRSLDGHLFQPSFLVRSPFTVQDFDVDLIYGAGDATGPTYDIRGNVDGERTYGFAAMGQTFAYDYKFADWFSAGAGLNTLLYSGSDSPSALVVGADLTVGGFARATASRQLGKFQVALTADIAYGPRLGIIVIDALKQTLANGIGSGSALQVTHLTTLQPGLALAWAPNPVVGVQASLDYQWVYIPAPTESTTGSTTGSTSASAITGAVAVDLDLAKLTNVPMGLLASGQWLGPLTGGNEISSVQAYSFGGFYTARQDVVLGAEIGWRKFKIRPPLDSSGTFLQIRATYYW